MEPRIVTIVGGTGFIGRYVVRQLAAAGYRLRIISRDPNTALHLKTAGNVGQVVLMGGNLADPNTLVHKLDNSYAVVNLCGILSECGRQRFSTIHAQGAEKLAKMARAVGVQRFIQVSALGIDKAKTSAYARSKLLGENAVLAAFPEATILRPSVVFGPEDNFFNLFARMASISPALPLIGGGKTKFQPVYVGDVAAAIEACITRGDVMGRTYELAGPHVYTFRQILEYILKVTNKHRLLVPVPFSLASLKAPVAQYLPQPFKFTPDQVRILKYDNVAVPNALNLQHLGVHPTAVEMVVPEYLSVYNRKAAA